jgi:hypothetical protein
VFLRNRDLHYQVHTSVFILLRCTRPFTTAVLLGWAPHPFCKVGEADISSRSGMQDCVGHGALEGTINDVGHRICNLLWKLTDVSENLLTSCSNLKIERVGSSESSVNFYLTARRHIPSDRIIHSNRLESLQFVKLFSGICLAKIHFLTPSTFGAQRAC